MSQVATKKWLRRRPKLEDWMMRMIRLRARRAMGKTRLNDSDLEDVEQDLIAALLEQLQVRPSATFLNAKRFVRMVLKTAVAKILARRRAEKRRVARTKSLQELAEQRNNGTWDDAEDDPEPDFGLSEDEHCLRLGTRRRSVRELTDLRHDMAVVLAKLPPDLRRLCEQLKRHSLSKVAEMTGTPRSTLQFSVDRIREFFIADGLDGYLNM